MKKKLIFSLLITITLIFVSCSPQTPDSAPLVSEVAPEGSVETRDLSSTIETVPNCGGSSSTITKHPSMTVLTTHAIEWEVSGQVGFGAKIGGSVIPGGIDLSSTLESSLAQSNESGVYQSTAWDLPAEPNSIMEYTLMWREIWQPGYVNVNLADGQVLKVNVTYRTGIHSDIIGQRKLNCEGGQAIPTQSGETISLSRPPRINIVIGGNYSIPPGDWTWVCTGDFSIKLADGTKKALYDVGVSNTGLTLILQPNSDFTLDGPFDMAQGMAVGDCYPYTLDEKNSAISGAINAQFDKGCGSKCQSVNVIELDKDGNEMNNYWLPQKP